MLRRCILLAWAGAATADVQLHFDEVGVGTSLANFYSSLYGITMIGLGDRGPFEVIADTPCRGVLSQPHVLSLNPVGDCPETNDSNGFFEISFATEQSFVSIRTLHDVPGTVSYLAAYSGPNPGDFLDQTFGDFAQVGVPQLLRVSRKPQDVKIRRVRFGVFNLDQSEASFDDLSFEKVPLANERPSWSAIKARW
jgi:hypothetical protein